MMLHYRFRQLSSYALLVLSAAAVFLFGAADAVTVALLQLAIALLAAAWAIRKLRNPYSFASTALYFPFAAITIAGGIQLLLGTSITPYGTQHGLSLWLVYAAFFVIAVNVQADPTIRTQWPLGACWLALAVSATAIVQMLFSRDHVLWRSVPGSHSFGPFADAEHFAILAELLFPIALVTALETRHRFLLGLAAATALAAAAAASGSRMGLILLVAEFAIILIAEIATLTMKRGREARRIVSSIGGLALVAAVMIVATVMEQMDPSRRDAVSTIDSGSLGAAAWYLFEQQPVIGHGLGSFFVAHDAAFSSATTTGLIGAEPLRLAAELGVAGVAARVLLFGLLLIMARTRRAWLAGVVPLAAAWTHSWTYGWLGSPALVLIALGVLALVATDGVARPLKGIFRPKANSASTTQTHQNHSPQRAYQVSSSE